MSFGELGITIRDFYIFVLMLFRISGLAVIAPFLGSQNIPARVRIGLAGCITLLVFPTVNKQGVAIPENLGLFLVAVLGEVAIGVIIGFVSTLIFAAVQLGGMLVDQELGLALANVIDPISNQQVSVLGQFKFFFALIIFLCLDGHHYLISGVAESFQQVPLLGFNPTNAMLLAVADKLGANLFVVAVKVSAPAVVVLLLTTVAMAFAARTVPEMNIFILGFALRIIVGFVILIASLEVFVFVFEKLTGQMIFGGHGIPGLRELTDMMR